MGMQTYDTEIGDLLKEVNSGKLQLPDFQRPWTWDDTHIVELIASISQGFPIGAMTCLEYGNPDILFQYNAITGVQNCSRKPDKLILDGQQRLTSMYQALYSDLPVKTTSNRKNVERFYYLSIEKCLDSSCDRIDAVISLPVDRRLKQNFDRDIILDVSTRELEYQNKMFPLNILFGDIMTWFMGYINYHTPNSPNVTDEINQFNAVLKNIQSYKVPVITLDSDTPREAVCKIFEHVNTGGVPLTVFELVTAIYAVNSCKLKDEWDHARANFCCFDQISRSDIFDGIDQTTFLTTICLYSSYARKRANQTGDVSCKKKDVLGLPYEEYKRNRDIVIEGYNSARKFLLMNEGVYTSRDLPYSTQLIPLAAICAWLGPSKCNNPRVVAILSQWYWCGILGEMYGSSNETRYANDIEDVINAIENNGEQIRTINGAFFSAPRLLTLQTRNSAAYKGIMVLLAKEKCRDFLRGTTIDVANSAMENLDIHHIFPVKYCESVRISREKYNCVINKAPIFPETNRSIGGVAPSLYLAKILKDYESIDEATLQERIESHHVNYHMLKADDFDAYFLDRARQILDVIEKAMGKAVPDRDSQETLQRFGASLVNKG